MPGGRRDENRHWTVFAVLLYEGYATPVQRSPHNVIPVCGSFLERQYDQHPVRATQQFSRKHDRLADLLTY